MPTRAAGRTTSRSSSDDGIGRQGAGSLETERLVLRQPLASDARAIFDRYRSDPDVTRYVGWPRHQTVAETEAFLQFSDAQRREWPAGPYLIAARADGRLLGGTRLMFDARILDR